MKRVNRDLMASVFDLTVAGRVIVDDDYGWEVWQMANLYAAQKPASDLIETVNLSGEQIRRTDLVEHEKTAAPKAPA